MADWAVAQDVCTALVLGWSSYASGAAAGGPDALVALALRAVSMLEACSKAAAEAAAKGQVPSHAAENIGACLAGRRQPEAGCVSGWFALLGLCATLQPAMHFASLQYMVLPGLPKCFALTNIACAWQQALLVSVALRLSYSSTLSTGGLLTAGNWLLLHFLRNAC